MSEAGKLWYSHDRGATWKLSASQEPAATYFYGTTLVVSSSSATTCWAGGSSYDGLAVYRSTDGGVTWPAISAGLAQTLVFGLALDPIKRNLYATAGAGDYILDAGSPTAPDFGSDGRGHDYLRAHSSRARLEQFQAAHQASCPERSEARC